MPAVLNAKAKRAFVDLGVIASVGGISAVLARYCWLLIEPQLAAMYVLVLVTDSIWVCVCLTTFSQSVSAAYVAALCAPTKRAVQEYIEQKCKPRAEQWKWASLAAALLCTCATLVHWFVRRDATPLERLIPPLLVASLLATSVLMSAMAKDSNSVATLFVMLTATTVTVVIALFVLAAMYTESLALTRLLRQVLNAPIGQIRDIVAKDDRSDYLWTTGADLCAQLSDDTFGPLSWLGWEGGARGVCKQSIADIRERLPDHGANVALWLAARASWLGERLLGGLLGIRNVVGNAGDYLFSVYLFIVVAYLLLRYCDDVALVLRRLSPLSDADKDRLGDALSGKLWSASMYTIVTTTCRFLVTLAVLSVAGVEFKWMLSFLLAFLAAVPVLSPLLVSFPVGLALALIDGFSSWRWILFGGSQLVFNLLIVDRLFDVFFSKGDSAKGKPDSIESAVTGVAFVLAVYSFGAVGALLGPIIAGTTISWLTIYLAHVKTS
jgi:predicted PurR-regulated permease PerM